MSGLDWFLTIFGGAALLLWGTHMVRTGMMRAYGGGLRRTVGRAGKNGFGAFGIGVIIAIALQSSTATGLLAVAFASQGLLSIATGLAVMLGADLGSTLVVLILSFDVSWLSPLLILVGVIVFMTSSLQHWQQVGRALIGLGLILLSLSLIVDASAAMRESVVLKELLVALAELPIIAFVIGALLTWAVHSSVATILLIMSIVAAGVIPTTLGFALVLGANVGSGIIPFALNWRSAAPARCILFGNLVFRLIGSIFILFLIIYFEPSVFVFDAPAMQIAGFHVAFNVMLGVIFLPLVNMVAKYLSRVFLDKQPAGSGTAKSRYLDERVVDRPGVALGCAAREIIRMAGTVETMLVSFIEVFGKGDEVLLEKLQSMDDKVNTLHESIKFYLTRVSRNPLGEEDSSRCMELISFAANLEHVGDIIDKNLLGWARKAINDKLKFSKEGWRELTDLHTRVLDQMQLAISVFVQPDVDTARQMVKQKEAFRELERKASNLHFSRLREGRLESVETSSLHMNIIHDLKRINSHLTSVAYPILDAAGSLRSSRLRKK